MKQVIQNFKTGELFVDDVMPPSISAGFVMVRNHYSLISAGTERTTVSTGKASLLGKARQRPDLVKQVLDTFKKEGFSETLKKVRTKLETLKELGYSSAGTVMMSMDRNGLFKPGDRVACGGGGYASHAGIISVPQNLLVKVPDSVSLEHAAFTTLGSIALQGIRQADPRLGENVCVIGLGLLGQISVQMLKAGGCRVFGIDTIPGMVSLALQTGCHVAMARDDKDLDAAADAFTEGYGFDSVIITAGTRSNDPVELATKILKKKGLVVVVGAVSMSIPREPHFYQKELELKISCSYGPGRYDHSYEEEGHDYPYGYVRWTENRNMVAFVKLLESGSVDLKPLVTHVIDIGEAERAYDIVTGKIQEPHIALLLKYPETEEIVPKKYVEKAGEPQPQIGVGFIGAGSFAQKFLIPYAKECGTLMGVVTAHGVTAKNVSEKFNFRMSSTEKTDLLANPEVNTIFIATRHNLHAALTAAALEAGKNVFVEKPLATCDDDLSRIADVYRKKSQSRLMVGFNRRFASLVTALKGELRNSAGPLVINYRINAGFIPKEHWIQTEDGGGRIIGEVCHFVDLVQYLTDSVPENVFSECISSRNTKTFNQDDVVITIRLSKGSVAVITYLGSGAKALPKERVEVSGSGRSYVIDDFQEGLFYNDSDCRKIKTPGKGHREEVLAFMKSIKDGMPSPIPFESLLYTTAATFRIIDSLQTGLPQKVVIP